MVETKMGQTDPKPVILTLQRERLDPRLPPRIPCRRRRLRPPGHQRRRANRPLDGHSGHRSKSIAAAPPPTTPPARGTSNDTPRRDSAHSHTNRRRRPTRHPDHRAKNAADHRLNFETETRSHRPCPLNRRRSHHQQPSTYKRQHRRSFRFPHTPPFRRHKTDQEPSHPRPCQGPDTAQTALPQAPSTRPHHHRHRPSRRRASSAPDPATWTRNLRNLNRTPSYGPRPTGMQWRASGHSSLAARLPFLKT
jgi:hypothetical protein